MDNKPQRCFSDVNLGSSQKPKIGLPRSVRHTANRKNGNFIDPGVTRADKTNSSVGIAARQNLTLNFLKKATYEKLLDVDGGQKTYLNKKFQRPGNRLRKLGFCDRVLRACAISSFNLRYCCIRI